MYIHDPLSSGPPTPDPTPRYGNHPPLFADLFSSPRIEDLQWSIPSVSSSADTLVLVLFPYPGCNNLPNRSWFFFVGKIISDVGAIRQQADDGWGKFPNVYNIRFPTQSFLAFKNIPKFAI